MDLNEFPDIGYFPGDRCSGCAQWAGEEGAGIGSLATLEVAVGGRDAVFAGGDLVFIHTQAGAAARLAEVESRRLEDLVDAFFDGLLLDLLAARDDPDLYVFRLLTAFDEGGYFPQVFDAGV